MKYCKRYLSLFVVFVLLFATFSITVNADSINYLVSEVIIANNQTSDNQFSFSISGSSGNTFSGESEKILNETPVNDFMFVNTMRFQNANGDIIAKKGDTLTFYLNNVFVNFYLYNNDKIYPWAKLDNLFVGLVYEDGTSEYFYDNEFVYDSRTQTHSIESTMTASKNVDHIFVQEHWSPYTRLGITFKMDYKVLAGFSPLSVSVNVQSEEAGLLSGILGWVKKTSEDVASGFANLVKGITELPQKLWDLISNGLKDLFVPDENYIVGYKDKWEELLSSRFGAIYQVGTIITDFVGRIQVSDKTNTIYMPSVSLNSVGIPFSFGGYDIQVVPSGFDALVEVCKKIISIVCTFLFINGLRKRYDEVMGVEQ